MRNLKRINHFVKVLKMTIKKKFQSAQDIVADNLDKVSGPTSRAGATLERIAKMAKAGVGNGAIKAQLEDNSHTGKKYSTEQIEGFKQLYTDAETKVGITAAQARALMADKARNPNDLPPDGALNPS